MVRINSETVFHDWTHKMPDASLPHYVLKHRTVWTACSEKLYVELRQGLESMGGTVIHFPVLHAQGLETTPLLDQAIRSLHEYNWIIFTSAYGVQFFLKRLKDIGADIINPPLICAIGPATAAAVQEAGFETALVAEKHTAEGILEAMKNYHKGRGNLAHQHILMPRALKAREVLPEALGAAGCRVVIAPCYQTVCSAKDLESSSLIQQKKPDLIVFTSAATVKNMIEILGRENFGTIMPATITAVIGPITARALEAEGRRADIVPTESTAAALLQAIGDYFYHV